MDDVIPQPHGQGHLHSLSLCSIRIGAFSLSPPYAHLRLVQRCTCVSFNGTFPCALSHFFFVTDERHIRMLSAHHRHLRSLRLNLCPEITDGAMAAIGEAFGPTLEEVGLADGICAERITRACCAACRSHSGRVARSPKRASTPWFVVATTLRRSIWRAAMRLTVCCVPWLRYPERACVKFRFIASLACTELPQTGET